MRDPGVFYCVNHAAVAVLSASLLCFLQRHCQKLVLVLELVVRLLSLLNNANRKDSALFHSR